MVSLPALRGYILEELLAALRRTSGYDLLVDASQDHEALIEAGNGLRVRGRGADHQVDALGQLRHRIPFTYPVRLFLEAKYRSAPVGLSEVRNALGVLNDVNEYYSAKGTAIGAHPTRYHYRYALCSATGFTSDAQRYAITQQISLVDLSSGAFASLRDRADRIARAVLELAQGLGIESVPVGQVRRALRRALGTWTLDPSGGRAEFPDVTREAKDAGSSEPIAQSFPADRLASIAAQAADFDGELLLGFTDAPFLLLLQPDQPGESPALLRGLDKRQIPAVLAFGGATAESGEWVLSVSATRMTFRLALPPEFEPWILGAAASAAPRASRHERSVTLLVEDSEAELTFDPVPTAGTSEIDRYSDVRETRVDPRLAFRGGPSPDEQPRWSETAARTLVARLRAERRPQADVIVEAARRGGSISREEVYRIARFPPTRMLRGFTRPARRITSDLIIEGMLDPEARWPLEAEYAHGVLASHFVVPPEFTVLLG